MASWRTALIPGTMVPSRAPTMAMAAAMGHHAVDGLLREAVGNDVLHQPLGAVGEQDAEDGADQGEDDGLAEEQAEDEGGGAADGLEDADLAGALEHGGVHGHEDDDEADDAGDPDDHVDEVLEHADAVDREHGGELLHGVDLVAGKLQLERVEDGVDLAGVVELEIDLADLVGISGDLLQGGELDADAGELAALVDAGDAPGVIDELQGVADVEVLFAGVVLVDEDVAVLDEGAALQVVEAAGHLVELVEVEAGDGVEAGERLHHGPGGEGDVGLGAEDGGKAVAHGGGAEADDRGADRANDDVGADALGAARGGVQGAVADADQGQDHRDFDGDREHAEEGAYRAVGEIGENELIEQDLIIRGGGYKTVCLTGCRSERHLSCGCAACGWECAAHLRDGEAVAKMGHTGFSVTRLWVGGGWCRGCGEGCWWGRRSSPRT